MFFTSKVIRIDKSSTKSIEHKRSTKGPNFATTGACRADLLKQSSLQYAQWITSTMHPEILGTHIQPETSSSIEVASKDRFLAQKFVYQHFGSVPLTWPYREITFQHSANKFGTVCSLVSKCDQQLNRKWCNITKLEGFAFCWSECLWNDDWRPAVAGVLLHVGNASSLGGWNGSAATVTLISNSWSWIWSLTGTHCCSVFSSFTPTPSAPSIQLYLLACFTY